MVVDPEEPDVELSYVVVEIASGVPTSLVGIGLPLFATTNFPFLTVTA